MKRDFFLADFLKDHGYVGIEMARNVVGHFEVDARINGRPLRLLIDTGASHTALMRNNPALSSMLKMKGKADKVRAMHSTGVIFVVEDVPIDVSGASFKLPVMVSPQSSSCWQGALGADLLQHCAVVWGADSLWAACRAPPPTQPSAADRPAGPGAAGAGPAQSGEPSR